LAEEIVASRSALFSLGQTQSVTVVSIWTAVMGIQAGMVKASGEAFQVGPGDAREALATVVGNLDDVQIKLNLALARGIAIGRGLTTAAAATALMANRWENQLESYLEGAPPSKELSMAEALWEAVAEEGAVGIAEHFLVEVVGMSNPVGGLVVGIAKITMDLRRKAAEVGRAYDRNDVDDMLDLAERMRGEREMTAEVVRLFEQVEELARLELRPSASTPSDNEL
jgi:hypothetical protein